MRELLVECYRQLSTIEAMTVSPTGIDELVELLARVRAALDEAQVEHERAGQEPV